MDHMKIQPRYFEILKEHFGSHSSVARSLGVTRIWYMRIRNQPDRFKPSHTLHNAIITLVHSINRENELLRRND